MTDVVRRCRDGLGTSIPPYLHEASCQHHACAPRQPLLRLDPKRRGADRSRCLDPTPLVPATTGSHAECRHRRPRARPADHGDRPAARGRWPSGRERTDRNLASQRRAAGIAIRRTTAARRSIRTSLGAGRVLTDANGEYRFTLDPPRRLSVAQSSTTRGGRRTSTCPVFGPSFPSRLVTQMYASRRSAAAARSDLQQRAPASAAASCLDLALRSRRHRTGPRAWLSPRHRAARPQRDADGNAAMRQPRVQTPSPDGWTVFSASACVASVRTSWRRRRQRRTRPHRRGRAGRRRRAGSPRDARSVASVDRLRPCRDESAGRIPPTWTGRRTQRHRVRPRHARPRVHADVFLRRAARRRRRGADIQSIPRDARR